jgi:hypothetical protein
LRAVEGRIRQFPGDGPRFPGHKPDESEQTTGTTSKKATPQAGACHRIYSRRAFTPGTPAAGGSASA